MITFHHFDSTGEAYNACNCDESINIGDVIVIENERVIGIADAWPVAVTVEYGKLHFPASGLTLQQCLDCGKFDNGANSIAAAKELAASLGYPVRD